MLSRFSSDELRSQTVDVWIFLSDLCIFTSFNSEENVSTENKSDKTNLLGFVFFLSIYKGYPQYLEVSLNTE